MSFSRSRKAARQARESGELSQLFEIEKPRKSEDSLWRPQSQLDLSLAVPKRLERLVIVDGESIDLYPNARTPAPGGRMCEGDFEKHADSIPVAPAPDDGQSPQVGLLSENMSKARVTAILAMICMVQILPLSALGTSFPTADIIATSFQITDPSILPWTVAAYALTFGTFILIAGRLGDIFGHKRMVILGFVLMAFSSLTAGLSVYSTYILYFVARALQGVSSATMLPNGLALLGGMYAPNSKKKNMAFALFGAMACTGAYLGMLFGALFAKYASWEWASYTLAITAVMCAILAQLVFVAPPPSALQSSSTSSKLKAMDWAGAVTGVTGLICIAIAWVQAPAQGWTTQYIYMLFIIGAVIIAGFVVIEIKVAHEPLVPFRTLTADVAFILAAVGLGWASFGVWIFYLWQFLLHCRLLSPLAAVVQVVPVFPMGFIGECLTGFLMYTTKPSAILCIALCAFTLGAVLMAITPVEQTYWALTFVSLVVIPFGMDMSFPAATVTMSNALPPEQQGIAGSLVATVVNYGMSLGLGFASTVQYYIDNNDSNSDPFAGYRGALRMSIGLGGLGTAIAAAYLVKDLLRERKVRSDANGGRAISRLKRTSSRLWSHLTLTPSKEDLAGSPVGTDSLPVVKQPSPISRASVRRSHIPILIQSMDAESRHGSSDTLWDPHPAVRPFGGADLIPRA